MEKRERGRWVGERSKGMERLEDLGEGRKEYQVLISFQCCSRESQERRVVCKDSLGNLQPPFLCSHIPRESSFKTCDTSPCSDGCTWVLRRWRKVCL